MSASQSNSRPKSVTAIGVIWMGLGVVMLLGGVGAFLAKLAAPGMIWSGPPGTLGPIDFVFDHFAFLALIQAVVAIFAIYLSVMLLGLRGWARAGLEGLSWVALVFVILFGVLFTIFWTRILGMGPEHGGFGNTGTMIEWLEIAMFVFIITMNSLPFIILVKWLRAREVKDACSQVPPVSRSIS